MAVRSRKRLIPLELLSTGVTEVLKYPARTRAVAAAIQRERTKAGLTRKALSLKLHEHHSFISRVERLQREVTVPELEAIAKAIGITPRQLFDASMR